MLSCIASIILCQGNVQVQAAGTNASELETKKPAPKKPAVTKAPEGETKKPEPKKKKKSDQSTVPVIDL
ncbi:MAG: DUF3684 domain-containing protein [Mesorhizobium sp.]|uniref:hypothetical protein n=1 Tax=Mesorhizobium sp. TaxID=1871066 RepID=UPI00120F7AFA|nr:hypothetical protein [Mesorhizobium sp.]TIM15517.1 MAG: DUF3684 domain-containing protein [Mesorhizobium sp.]